MAARLKELMKRIAPIIGFGVKVVEKTGRSIKSSFPLSSLWDGAACGREECITCKQGADKLPPCTRRSVVYENSCVECNQGADGEEGGAGHQGVPQIPSVYVGESSRSLQERAVEHWRAAKSSKQTSHMRVHQEQHHGGREPRFMIKPVSFHKTALSRQVSEAVRIRRRGGEGAILNSKAEFSRCYIPRLQVEPDEMKEQREKKEREELELLELEAEEGLKDWEKVKLARRKELLNNCMRTKGRIREREEERLGTRPTKRRKHEVLGEEWGEEGATDGTPSQGMDWNTPPPTLTAREGLKNSSILQYFKKTEEVPQRQAESSGKVEKQSSAQTCSFTADRMCVLHGCEGKIIKLSTTRWGWKPKQKCYGNVYKKVSKLICTARKRMPIGPKISTPVDSNISGQRTDIRAGIRKSFHYTDLGIRQNLDRKTETVLALGESEIK